MPCGVFCGRQSGRLTFWNGLHPPHGNGLAWGWLIMGGVFLLVGLGSVAAYFATQGLFGWSHSEMSGRRLAVYWAMTVIAVLVGVPLGIAALGAV